MKKYYPKLHLWLILPLVLILFGFHNYWITFSTQPFQKHVHGLSSVAWFIILVIQPWIYNKKSLKIHRKVGMISLILAGIVASSALLMIKNNLLLKEGPLYPIRYSISFIDLFLIAGFVLSVVMAIIKSKNIHVHARWMISTIFWILTPGLIRLSMKILSFNPDNPYTLVQVYPLMFLFSGIFIAILILLDYVREKKFYFAYVLTLVINLLSIPVLLGLKDAAWLKTFLDSLLT